MIRGGRITLNVQSAAPALPLPGSIRTIGGVAPFQRSVTVLRFCESCERYRQVVCLCFCVGPVPPGLFVRCPVGAGLLLVAVANILMIIRPLAGRCSD